MTIPPGLGAELALLTQALDLPDADVAETLTRLAADARATVDSYLGLSIAITAHRATFDLTVLDEGTQPDHVRTSLLVPLSAAVLDEDSSAGRAMTASIALILYAAAPGAFVDLAADFAWITGRPAVDFPLDEHRTLPANYADPTHLGAMSTINQAVGVLIGHGATHEEADRDLSARAAAAEIDLIGAANFVLAALRPPGPEGV